MATPILKWAGGKRQLMPIIDELLPKELKNGTIKKFVEPFFGGGAVFFHIVENYDIEQAYISDFNIELVLLYKVVQKEVEKLITELQKLSDDFFEFSDDEKRKELFYRIREKFNENHDDFDLDEINDAHIERAAQIIFLNKTCFNGLFRVNKKGGFNVPFAKPKNPKILDAENLRAASNALQIATIEHASYHDIPEEFLNDASIYFDPPYRPLNQSSSFTSYSKYDFNDIHQKELALYFTTLSKEYNSYLMLSNSDPKNTNEEDDFFDDLYKEFTIRRVSASRMINSKSSKRGKVNELLITNYN